jgi:hypothetical protein
MGKVRWIWWPPEGVTHERPVVYEDYDGQSDNAWRHDGGTWQRVVIIPVEDD